MSQQQVITTSAACIQLYRMCVVSPLQHAGRGNQTGAGRYTGQLPGLPPLSIRLVDHLQQVSSAERHPCIRTGDGGVLQGAVVHHCFHVHLTDGEKEKKENLNVAVYLLLNCKLLSFISK